MKIQNITDVEAFFKVIDECKGPVELISPEGDRISSASTSPWPPCFPTDTSMSWTWSLMRRKILNG